MIISRREYDDLKTLVMRLQEENRHLAKQLRDLAKDNDDINVILVLDGDVIRAVVAQKSSNGN